MVCAIIITNQAFGFAFAHIAAFLRKFPAVIVAVYRVQRFARHFVYLATNRSAMRFN
jgi:hypothetical protein